VPGEINRHAAEIEWGPAWSEHYGAAMNAPEALDEIDVRLTAAALPDVVVRSAVRSAARSAARRILAGLPANHGEADH
jgi:hypothetical protein